MAGKAIIKIQCKPHSTHSSPSGSPPVSDTRPNRKSPAGARFATGRNVLISAPTGSGKTLAAFLICLDGLVRAARTGSLAGETQVLYVSPAEGPLERRPAESRTPAR